MLVHDYLRATAKALPDKIAVVAQGIEHRFSEIDAASDLIAVELQRLGIRRGDRVASFLENSVEFVLVVWASLKAGATFVPINSGVKADKLAFILEDAGVSAIVARDRLEPVIVDALARGGLALPILWAGSQHKAPGEELAAITARAPARPADPGLIDQDLSLLIYTSGSTGRPKGVMMTHSSIANNVWSISTYLRNTPDDVVLCVLPMSFDYGLFQILTGARVGFTVILERSFTYPYEVLKKIGAYRVTGLPGVPTIFAKLLQSAPFEGLDLSSLRYISNTAAAFPAAHIEKFMSLLPGLQIFSMFGLTECTRVSYLEPERLAGKIMSVGRSMPNSETYIVDEAGKRCAPREIGELVIRGTSVMRGYWRRPEETAKALRDGDIPGEKVLYSGDLFWADEEGDLYFVGRRDDVFKCRGEKVSPREVEACLYELETIAESAVIGVPDEVDGMAIKAYIVPRADAVIAEAALRQHCNARLEPRLVPRFFEICSELPKTDSGKISSATLRRAATASA